STLTDRRIPRRTTVALVAGLGQRLRRPAEAALLIALASRGGAAVRRRAILAIRIIEHAFGPPDDISRRRSRWIATHRLECRLVEVERPARFEEPKRAFDFPDQIGGLAGVGGEAEE